jgi:4-phytase/acid phosphatase
VGHADSALAVAAVNGRIGGNVKQLAQAYRPQLAVLDQLLAGCGHAPQTNTKRTSIFEIPATLELGKGDHAIAMRGPLNTASTLSENLLLEYTEGITGANLGFGCLDEATLRTVLQLHSAAAEVTERTPAIARMEASNLLDTILKAIEQSAAGKPVAGAPGKPSDRVLFLSGHDTNIATVAGALDLKWIIDGRRDDTPPGGALVFELWRSASGAYSVRLRYTAQTLDQMRNATPLTLANPPADALVFVPACGKADGACSLEGFADAMKSAIATEYVKKPQ